jgi:hypothetical protein
MTEETTSTQAPAENNVNISIEQICAAIINTISSVEVPLENLIKNYADKSIAINQDSETKAVTFTLVDAPTPQESEEESKQDSE